MKSLFTIWLVLLTVLTVAQDNCDTLILRQKLDTLIPNWKPYHMELEKAKCLYHQQNFEGALTGYGNVLSEVLKEGDKKTEALVYYYSGLAHFDNQNGLFAIDEFKKALSIPEGLSEEQIIHTNNVIGIIFLIFEEYNKAIPYFDKAIALSQQLNKRHEHLYNNKGICFARLGMFDSSIVNHNRCLQIRLEKEDNLGIGQSYNNLGELYYELKNFDSSLYYYEEGYEYRKKSEGIAVSGIQESKINIAKAKVALKQYAEAESILKETEIELRSSVNEDLKLRLYKQLMLLNEGKKSYKYAYEYSKEYFLLKDSIFGMEQREELIRKDISIKYTEKKLQDSIAAAEQIRMAKLEEQRQIVLREQRERESAIIQWALIIALVLMIGIVVLVYKNYRGKKKSSEEILAQKQEVEKQRDIAEREKQIADEQRELTQHQKMELELVHQEITDSINYAKRIQYAILPADNYVEKALHNYFILYEPKAIVAGDFYWVEEVDNKVFFAAADCTGHGVPGALVSIICSNALNRALEEFKLRQPGEILDKVTDLLIEAFEKTNEEVKDGMDISLCVWDKATNLFTYAGANNSVYIVRKKQGENFGEEAIQNELAYLIEVKGNKQAVGWQNKRQPFTTHQLDLQKGDLIYLSTDGFPDQFGGVRGKKYKYKKFKQFLVAISNKSLEDQKEKLRIEFTTWKGDLEQVDDVCILGFKVSS